MNMDPLHNSIYMHKLDDENLLSIRHYYHMLVLCKGLDTFLGCMQGDWGIQGQRCIQVL